MMQFSIVTPVLNGARFIDETIHSVVSQAGDFTIRYHVQDGGSTDTTMRQLARWQRILSGNCPLSCRGIEFSYANVKDRGIYDAVNKGFEATVRGDAMAWINADDRFEPGAFQAVAQVFDRFADVNWLNGRATFMDESGAMVHSYHVVVFPQECIHAGIFDGRFSSYIQQEGTFWRSSLWEGVGGLNADLSLAGDFDLWRRMARISDMVVVDTILACWRRVPGQLSENKNAYHAEIDALLTSAEKSDRAAVSARYRDGQGHGYSCRVIGRQGFGDWASKSMTKHALFRRYVFADFLLRFKNAPITVSTLMGMWIFADFLLRFENALKALVFRHLFRRYG